jgi:hypothetical protein
MIDEIKVTTAVKIVMISEVEAVIPKILITIEKEK